MSPLDFILNGRFNCHSGGEMKLFFSPSENAEADCLLKSLMENLKTETSQQGKESN